MFSLRNRFGIPGVISVIALVFAMLGGAYAANHNGSSATASAKKGPRGPKGATGPAGPAGAAGAVGPAGPAGSAGAKGDTGSAGPTGPAGATGSAGAKGATGAAGATGATGATGASGQTGFTETLPPGKTETGMWAIQTSQAGSLISSISFPIPLNEPELIPAHVLEPGAIPTTECPGTAAEPLAEEGNVCLYESFVENIEGIGAVGSHEHILLEINKATNFGAVLLASASEEPEEPEEPEGSGPRARFASASAVGTFAVTANSTH